MPESGCVFGSQGLVSITQRSSHELSSQLRVPRSDLELSDIQLNLTRLIESSGGESSADFRFDLFSSRPRSADQQARVGSSNEIKFRSRWLLARLAQVLGVLQVNRVEQVDSISELATRNSHLSHCDLRVLGMVGGNSDDDGTFAA